MDTATLIASLGGNHHVAQARGVTSQAVSNWIARDSIPAEHQLPLWQMALEQGIDWQPQGASNLARLIAARFMRVA